MKKRTQEQQYLPGLIDYMESEDDREIGPQCTICLRQEDCSTWQDYHYKWCIGGKYSHHIGERVHNANHSRCFR